MHVEYNSANNCRKIFRKALRIWSRYSNLRFKYTRKKPDIRILFARYEHGDGDYNAFDGQGNRENTEQLSMFSPNIAYNRG